MQLPLGRTAAGLLAVALFGFGLTACGPTQSTALIMDGDVQLEAARMADAPKLAPYEFTAAEVYLHKAREEQGYSDFDISIDFGKKAVKFATEAKKKSMAAKADGALPNVPTLPPPSPRAEGRSDAITVDKVEKTETPPVVVPPPPPTESTK
ncbi:MAG TPA: hypothetical protein VGK67_25575 [Myxococcales bacterium]|jgi:hypothetical protein